MSSPGIDRGFERRLATLVNAREPRVLQGGLKGVEKESLRVSLDGYIEQSEHPRELGSTLTHEHITTDYSEALIELVTPAFKESWELLQYLCDLHQFVYRHLGEQLLWATSMPCIIDGDPSIPIARYGRSNIGKMKEAYRRGLGWRYGRMMQAISGVHYNYSFPAHFWPVLAAALQAKNADQDFVSTQYFGLLRNYRRYGWLILYLFGNSPALCSSFVKGREHTLQQLAPGTLYEPYATSLRMSDLGYRNGDQARWAISANSLEEYLAGMRTALTTEHPAFAAIGVRADGDYRQLNTHILQIENEYYSNVRPKPPKTSTLRPLLALERGGIEYIEVRTLDLSVADPVGVNQAELRLLEAMLIYCLLADSPSISASEQAEIAERERRVALHGRQPDLRLPHEGGQHPLRDIGLALLDELLPVAALLDTDNEGYVAAIEAQRAALVDPNVTPSARFLAAMREHGGGFFDYVRSLAAAHREYLLALPVNAERERAFDALAGESLAAAHALERDRRVGFDEYLAREINALP